MIFWFSGTGNSRWVALQLAAKLGERLVDVADCMVRGDYDHALQPGECIGWVFPTYSWGPPPVVLEFVSHWYASNYVPVGTYCYMVTTCGDDIGLSADIFSKALGYVGLSAAFSVQMPNNYILLPGFDTDPDDLQRSKLENAVGRVDEVASAISAREHVIDVVTGKYSWLKSCVIRSVFLRTFMSDRPFFADDELCDSCGTCAAVCPMHNIILGSDGRPHWHGNCAMCLSCIHHCPHRAIQYGKITRKKGRYLFKRNNDKQE